MRDLKMSGTEPELGKTGHLSRVSERTLLDACNRALLNVAKSKLLG